MHIPYSKCTCTYTYTWDVLREFYCIVFMALRVLWFEYCITKNICDKNFCEMPCSSISWKVSRKGVAMCVMWRAALILHNLGLCCFVCDLPPPRQAELPRYGTCSSEHLPRTQMLWVRVPPEVAHFSLKTTVLGEMNGHCFGSLKVWIPPAHCTCIYSVHPLGTGMMHLPQFLIVDVFPSQAVGKQLLWFCNDWTAEDQQ